MIFKKLTPKSLAEAVASDEALEKHHRDCLASLRITGILLFPLAIIMGLHWYRAIFRDHGLEFAILFSFLSAQNLLTLHQLSTRRDLLEVIPALKKRDQSDKNP